MLRKLLVAVGLLTAAAVSATQPALSDRMIDSLAASMKVVYLDGRPSSDVLRRSDLDSLKAKITHFYYDQFRAFADPAAPYFLFMSKDAQLAMGIGGCVRMRGYYDWGGAIPAAGFAPMLIPMHPEPGKMKHFDTTPAGSTLFFRVIGRNKTLGEYQLYIEGNFNGYQGRDFHLKKAYAEVDAFTIGYAPSTFSDPAALPPTVDAQGPTNKVTPTSVLIRYMPVIKNRWALAVSVETPSSPAFTADEHAGKVDNWMPDFAAFVQYQWGRSQHVRLAGIVRTLSYRNLVAGQNRNVAGWGVQLSSTAHLTPALTYYATFNYGHGVAGLGGDLAIGNFDLLPDPSEQGRLYAPSSYGWCLGLQYHILHNLFVSASASQSRFLAGHGSMPSEYRYGVATDANVFWNLTPRIQVGAEFAWGMRHNADGSHRAARRIGAMCQFSF